MKLPLHGGSLGLWTEKHDTDSAAIKYGSEEILKPTKSFDIDGMNPQK
jgi:hypothetical protein